MGPPAGLCDSCRHQRVIRNTRGSSFSMCGRAKTEERYPKYPRLPVLECGGYERDRPGDAPAGDPGSAGAGPRSEAPAGGEHGGEPPRGDSRGDA